MGINKKAFVRSLEVLLAIILFISYYNIVLQDNQTLTPKADFTILSNQLIMSLMNTDFFKTNINSLEIEKINKVVRELLPATQGFKFELSYFEVIQIKNTLSSNVTQNVSFIKFFPFSINEKNIKLYEDDIPKSIEVINNYYQVDISSNSEKDLFNDVIKLDNVLLTCPTDKRINLSGIRAYVNNERATLNINSINYNHENYSANISISILIDNIKKHNDFLITIFYPTNESAEINEYEDISEGNTLFFTQTLPEKSKTSEIRFNLDLTANEEKDLYLNYEINTDLETNYDSFITNNSFFTINMKEDYYPSQLLTKQYEMDNTQSIKKTIQSKDKDVLINLKVWKYE